MTFQILKFSPNGNIVAGDRTIYNDKVKAIQRAQELEMQNKEFMFVYDTGNMKKIY